MATKRTGKPRGRQPESLDAMTDRYVKHERTTFPDKHVIGLAEFFIRRGESARKAFADAELVFRHHLLSEEEASEPSDRAQRKLVKYGAGHFQFYVPAGDEDGTDPVLETAYERLKNKRKRMLADPIKRQWLEKMAACWTVVFTPESPIDETTIRVVAASIGEADFADAIMIPAFRKIVAAPI